MLWLTAKLNFHCQAVKILPMTKQTCQCDILPHPHAESLTLIHGWGADNQTWFSWAKAQLQPYYQIHMIELPGFGNSPSLDLDPADDQALNETWLTALADALPNRTHLLGWSLGGLLAQQLAARHPDRIQSLTCLASTARFTQNDGWQWAVSPPLLADFIQALAHESSTVVKKFWRLQLQGSDNGRHLMKQLMSQMQNRHLPSFAGLIQGLRLLKAIDNRHLISQLKQPTLWLLGENDPLIPADIQQAIQRLQPQSQIKLIEGASHMPFFSHPQQTADALLHFLKTTQFDPKAAQ